uniref:Uncharacterized protein n=1 Tax=Moniliophthora roreri TaxID=221103 RepID=A0A0W0F6P0_MONRR
MSRPHKVSPILELPNELSSEIIFSVIRLDLEDELHEIVELPERVKDLYTAEGEGMSRPTRSAKWRLIYEIPPAGLEEADHFMAMPRNLRISNFELCTLDILVLIHLVGICPTHARPSPKQLSSVILICCFASGSPNLTTLEPFSSAQGALFALYRIVLPFISLTKLDIAYYDIDREDEYNTFARQLVRASTGQTRSILTSVGELTPPGLPLDDPYGGEEAYWINILREAAGVEILHLNVSRDEREVPLLELLMGDVVYLPNMHTMTNIGLGGSWMRKFVEHRVRAGRLFKRLGMCMLDSPDKVSGRLRAHVEDFYIFRPAMEAEANKYNGRSNDDYERVV